MDIKDRKTQKVILAISIAIILWGLYDLIAGNPWDLFNFNDTGTTSSRHTPLIVIVFAAIVMAFFSAKNLLRKE